MGDTEIESKYKFDMPGPGGGGDVCMRIHAFQSIIDTLKPEAMNQRENTLYCSVEIVQNRLVDNIQLSRQTDWQEAIGKKDRKINNISFYGLNGCCSVLID
jgi:hypothetical protein